MPQGAIDIKLLGDKKVARALSRLPINAQKKAIRPALRASAKRMRPMIAKAFAPFDDTGRLSKAMKKAKIKSVSRKTIIIVGIAMPERRELGIKGDAKGYYPFSIEYGFRHTSGKHVPPKAPIRRTMNASKDRELAQIGRDLGKEIAKQWSRLTK